MRRPLIILLLVAIVAAVTWWLLHFQGGPAQEADPWSAVPEETLAVLEVPEPFTAWERFTGTSQFWGEMDTTREGKAWTAMFLRLGESLMKVPSLARQLQLHPVVLSFSENDQGWPGLVAMNMPHSADAAALIGAGFRTEVPESLWTGKALEVQPDSAFPAMVLGWQNGVLLIGRNTEEVEKARKQMNSRSRPDAQFTKAKATFSAGSDAHLLIRSGAASSTFGGAEGIFPNGAKPGGWMAFDVRLRPGALLLNGLLFPEDEAALAVLRHQNTGPASLLQVLPAGVEKLKTISITNAAQAVKELTGAAAEGPAFDACAAWVKGAIGVAAMANADSTLSRWAVLGTDAPEQAEKALISLCPDNGCITTEYRSVQMRQLPGDQLGKFFGADFNGFANALWCILGDQVVFAETPAAMRAAIDAWTDRNSMALDPRSGEFFTRYATDANCGWWVDAARTMPAAEGAIAAMRKATGGCLLQLSARADGAYTATVCAQHAPNAVGTATPRQAGALWTTALGAPLEGPPLLVRDYLSKTVQVLAQDKDHRISLVSCTGKVLWQHQLDGPLLGGVEQVDRYRNGKLQLVFSTAEKIYMIDRLGRAVEGFPVKLAGRAAAPIAVLDYDNNKDYRILTPLVDGRLQNFGADGKATQGWSGPGKGVAAIAAVEHARIQGKDYILVPLRDGRVEVIDRRGEGRYKSKLVMHRVARICGSRKAMEIGNWRMLWEDSTGAVVSGALSGATDTLDKPKSGTATLLDVKGDGNLSVLRTTGSTLSAADGKKALFSVSFPDAASAKAFSVALPDGAEAVGLVLPEQDQVRLYNAEGELWPGFPLAGSTEFSVADINLDGTLELVTANAEGVITVYALPAAP